MKAIAIVMGFAALAFAQQPETATLSGRTLDSNGAPLRKSTVTLRPTGFVLKPGDAPPQPYEGTSDAEGKFLFTGIDPGKYVLSAEHPGYLRANYAAGGNPASAPALLSVLGGHDLTDLTIRLIEQSVITGKVVDDDGDPVLRVQVRLSRQGYMLGRRQLTVESGSGTDENGEFRLSGIAAGKYYLSAEPLPAGGPPRPARAGQPEERWVSTYFPGVAEVGSATMIEVPPAQTVRGVNIRMLKSVAVHVRGRVSGVGSDLSSTRIALTPVGGASFSGMNGSAAIAKDGSFDLPGVVPGRYTLAVNRMAQILGVSTVDVGKEDISDVVISAGVLPNLHGSVRIEGPDQPPPANTPVPQIRIALIASESPVGLPSVTVSEDGAFTVTGLGTVKYFINVSGIPPGSYLKSASLGTRDVLEDGLDLTAGPVESTLQIIISRAAGQIGGTVLDADGKAAPGSVATLIPETPHPERNYLYQFANTDQNGQFQWKSVRPGRYRIYAWEQLQGNDFYDPQLVKGLEGRGTEVTVAENDHQQFSLTRISIAQAEEAARRNGR